MLVGDLHIHSKYSRATSKNLDLENLAYWGLRKGIQVVGTADFTHPEWRQELKEKLVPAEPGLFALRPELEDEVRQRLGAPIDAPIRFMLSVEISSIYKRHEKTRKIHNCVYAASFETVNRLVARLETIGNLKADGRPILGLDSRDLLEIVLESGDDAYLIPAHVWTPWFALFGSKSGFDSIDECFGDLSSHIFAVETGLSSDPEMNWRLSMLDNIRLVSNSDAHSPSKLGREATLYDTELNYFSMRQALESGEGFGGTIEFFPEEGKYHLDGHRKCKSRLGPAETRANQGRCPVCGKEVTVGVMNRVAELADRAEGYRPSNPPPVHSLVPLPELIAETVGTRPGSKKVERIYERMIRDLGPEFEILRHRPLDAIEKTGSDLLAESIRRLRSGEVIREAGYDGEYGVIRMFRDDELDPMRACGKLFDAKWWGKVSAGSEENPGDVPGRPGTEDGLKRPVEKKLNQSRVAPPARTVELAKDSSNNDSIDERSTSFLDGLDSDQRVAALVELGPVLLIAGPGSGKTRTLSHRLAHLIDERGVEPEKCMAITFTRRAAAEMQQRLTRLISDRGGRIRIGTFHSIAQSILRRFFPEYGDRLRNGLGWEKVDQHFSVAHRWEQLEALSYLGSESKAKKLLERISESKTGNEGCQIDESIAEDWSYYHQNLHERNKLDCDDLIPGALLLLEIEEIRSVLRSEIQHLSIDEYQDVDELQYRFLRGLVPEDGNLFAIGDPDQSIYGFRGANVEHFLNFKRDFPKAKEFFLNRNYRSDSRVVQASQEVIAASTLVSGREFCPQRDSHAKIQIHAARTADAEAEFVVSTLESLLGGHSFFSIDSGRSRGDARARRELSFSDIAVLARSRSLLVPIEKALERSGMPFQSCSHHRLDEEPGVQALVEALKNRPPGESLELSFMALAQASPDFAEVVDLLRPLAQINQYQRNLFLSAIAEGAQTEIWDPRADRISLMTLHASKGLEFPVVFIVGCEQGSLPLTFSCYESKATHSPIDEERRLFFVGMTRAEDHLFLSYAAKRVLMGRVAERKPSEFLSEISEALLERSQTLVKTKKGKQQLDLF